MCSAKGGGGEVTLLFLIPARGGSKGLPGKNLALIGGLPLVSRAVRTARQAAQTSEEIIKLSAPLTTRPLRGCPYLECRGSLYASARIGFGPGELD